MSNKSGVSSQVLPLPVGGGALSGIGETFSPDLFTGTGNMTIPLALPPGRNGFQPELSLDYSTGNGNGPFGLGWQLSIPGVTRKTAKGVPRYRDAVRPDTFVLSGAEDLVRIGDDDGAERFRPRTEGLFARIEHERSASSDVWRVHTCDGLVSVYGTPGAAPGDPAVLADPADPGRTFAWMLSETLDSFGNRIVYDYLHDSSEDPARPWTQLYPRRVRYVDFKRDDETRFLVSVLFEYEPRPDPFSDCRPGFETRTRLRCRRIEVRTHADANTLVRTYELDYAEASRNGVSLLARFQLVGHDGDAREPLPPLELGYTDFAPEVEDIRPLSATSESLPAGGLAADDVELVGLFSDGLPDLVQINGIAQFWRNQGGGVFAAPQTMPEVPASVHLPDPGVHMIDVNGDGRADLLAVELAGYFPLGFDGRWDAERFVPYDHPPPVALGGPDVRFVDVDGDGIVDALRSGAQGGFELVLNHGTDGWGQVEPLPPLPELPELSLADPRVKLGDLNGDGLQDLVLVEPGRVDYWPNLGHGRWGPRLRLNPGPVGLPPPGEPFDPERVLVGDVDGDGLDDIVYVEPRRATVWINRGGNGLSDPIHVDRAPLVNALDGVRLVDVLGGGTAGLLWSTDTPEPGAAPYQYLDLTRGAKPYLLERIDNQLGAVTKIRYAPSTAFRLADAEPGATPWRTPLPFPVQVVAAVEVSDEISHSRQTREFRYHHGYWDGAEREFRGFGMVEQLDTERVSGEHGAPPLLEKTWFHLGPVGFESGERTEADLSAEYSELDLPLLGRAPELQEMLDHLPEEERGNALRSLRGQVVRTERYALDGSERAGRPLVVTETQYSVQEKSPPATDAEGRTRVFFPHVTVRRSTRWERGDDPLTTFTFVGDYDEFGSWGRLTEVACPRGWRSPSDRPEEGYLATRTERQFAVPLDARQHLHDRLARTITSQLLGTAGKQVMDLPSSKALAIIGDALNFYDGPAFEGLPLGRVGAFGALTRSETLAFTEETLRRAHSDRAPPYLSHAGPPQWTDEYPDDFRESLPALAGYTFHDSGPSHSGGYYVQSERHRYDFHNGGRGRGLRVALRDPLGTADAERDTMIGYDGFGLLPTEVTDPAGLTTRAEYDYRALQVGRMTDPNGNRTTYAFTPLGLLAEVRLLGQPERKEGDREHPSVHLDYDLLAFANSPPDARQPISVRTTRRVHHDADADVPAPERDASIVSVEFSDGFGRLVQTRTQAEEAVFGDVTFGDALLPTPGGGPDPSDPVTGLERPTNVRVSGLQVYDNKGRVVERFEPYFDQGFQYAPAGDAALRQKVTIVYDTLGRAERTKRSDGSEQRVVFGVPVDHADPDEFTPTPWETFTYDANDNAGRTHGVAADAFRSHWNTPSSAVVDALGRAVVSVERLAADGMGELVTLRAYDIQGNVVSVHDSLDRDAMRAVYDLAGNALRIEHADAGVRTSVIDAAGNPVERRDGKGALILHAHDNLNRGTRLWGRDREGDTTRLAEQVTYGDGGTPGQPEDAREEHRSANRLGRAHEHYDEAGRQTFDSYDFKGNLLESTREGIADAAILSVFPATGERDPDWHIEPFRVNWTPPAGTSLEEHAAKLLEPSRHAIGKAYDALNRPRAIQYPEDVEGRRRTLHLRHGPAGGLEQAMLDGDALIERIAYNASGQRTLLALSNGVMTRWAHDERTSQTAAVRSERFTKPAGNALAYRPVGPALDDYTQSYDLMCNLVTVETRAPGTGTPLEPDRLLRSFRYDAAYRLISATGREHVRPAPSAPWDDPPRGQDPTKSPTLPGGI